MKKTSNTSSKNKKQAKEAHGWQDYFCMHSFKMVPANDVTIEKFCLEWLTDMRNTPDRISTWYYPEIIRGVDHKTVQGWMERNEIAKRTHYHIKRICAHKRDFGAAFNKMNANYIMKSMPLYSDEWKEMIKEADEFKINLANKLEGKANGQQIVVIERYPESDLVPKKVTE